MLGARRDERDGVLAQSRAQAVDERHGRGGFVAGEKTQVAPAERGGVLARERDRFDRCRQRDAREPLAQHGDEVRGLASRCGQPDADVVAGTPV